MNPDSTSLDRLHDVITSPPVPWWPPAPGWYWSFGLLLVLALALVLRGIVRWQRNRYRHEALAELKRQVASLRDSNHRAASLAALAELLKRAALSAWPREEVASLTGPAWLDFLDRTAGSGRFSKGPGAALEQVAYDPRVADTLSEDQLQEIIAVVRHWLKKHQREEER